MKDNRLKEEFMAIEIPEMKPEILAKIHRQTDTHPRRRVRPAAIAVIAAMLAVFGITAGAVTGGMLNLKNGSKYYFTDADGNIVKPTGFHLEGEIDVPLSETALANITPYLWFPAEGDTKREFETPSLEEMEEFLDMSLILPESVKTEAVLYRLNAAGNDGRPVSIHLHIQTAENPDAMSVYLLDNPDTIMTASEPEMEDYTLPDGTPVTIAVAKYQEGGRVAHALYRMDEEGAVYHLRTFADSKRELLETAKAILDTVE